MATRTGRQKPTQSVILPYQKTEGGEAAKLYDQAEYKALEWQRLLLNDIMAINEEGLWTHITFGYAVPRRNGKNEILIARELYALTKGEKILHTAHRTSTSHSAWERLCAALDHAKIEYRSLKQMGLERIEVKDGGTALFRTRSSKGGLGEGFDLLVIDEAQEYTDDQRTALQYVTSAAANPQTLMCGTPPTTVSAGTVFLKYRKELLAGDGEDSGWAEWSVQEMSDPKDTDLWYETNPSLGFHLTERKIRQELKGDTIDFNIQRLGLWLRYNQKSAITKAEWEALACEESPELEGKLYVGIKFGRSGTNAALSVAARTKDGKIFLETIDCRPVRAGSGWIMRFLKAADIAETVVDGQSGQQLLADSMKDAGVKKPVMPTVKDIIAANAAFEQALEDGIISHMNQPSLMQSASNCDKRDIGSGGGFGYKSIRADIDIVLLESAILAFRSCQTGKRKKKQKIRC